MEPTKIQNNYNDLVRSPDLPAFVYEIPESSYEDKFSLLDTRLWQSYKDSGKVSPIEIETTLLEESPMDIERVVLSFKKAIERLHSDALELMYVAKPEDGYIEIWIYGNQIPEQIQNRIYEIDFKFGGRFPETIGDVHISDRRGRPMSKHATFDMANEDSYALYRLSSQLWLPQKNTKSSGDAITIFLQS